MDGCLLHQVEKLFNDFKADTNGTVSYRDIGVMLTQKVWKGLKEQLKRVIGANIAKMSGDFQLLDADGSGAVTKVEFRKLVANMGTTVTDEMCDGIFDDYDRDGSGEMGLRFDLIDDQ